MILYLIVGLLILGLIIFIASLKLKKDRKIEPDYYTFFLMGLVCMPIGITSGNNALFIMGLVFMALGITNKDKWKQNHRTWKDLDYNERKIHLFLIGFLLLLVVLGIVMFFLFN